MDLANAPSRNHKSSQTKRLPIRNDFARQSSKDGERRAEIADRLLTHLQSGGIPLTAYSDRLVKMTAKAISLCRQSISESARRVLAHGGVGYTKRCAQHDEA
jgi:hypothetical protein